MNCSVVRQAIQSSRGIATIPYQKACGKMANSKNSVRLFLISVVGCLFLLNSTRLMLVGTTQPDSTARDGLLVSPAVADLGDVEQGEVREITFTLKNISDEPIKQIAFITSCGCAMINTPKSALDPGESTQAIGEFNSLRRRGLGSVNLLLRYDVLGQESQRILTVTANVKPFVVFEPTALRLALPDDPSDSRSSGLVTFTSAKHRGFQLEELSCWHPAISVREIESLGFSASDGLDLTPHSIVVEVTLDHQKWNSVPRDAGKHVLLSVLTNIGTEPRLTIPIIVD